MKLHYIRYPNRMLLPILLLFFLLFLRFFLGAAMAQETRYILWVYDESSRDSQFGYYDGSVAQATQPIYQGADIEGLACLSNIIYASGGLDGRAPSTLNSVVIDIDANTSTLTKIADIYTADGDPFFEVVSLSVHDDGALWGYADYPPQRGIIRIDPSTGIAELVMPSSLKVEGMAWIGNTLWLAGDHNFYRWTPGGEITFAFAVDGVDQVESLEAIDGLLYAGVHKDDRGVIAIDPNTGVIVVNQGFPAPNDIEGLTFCPLQPEPTPTPTDTPLATDTGTPTATSTPTLPTTATPTATSVETATATATQSQTGASETATPTSTHTATPIATSTETATTVQSPTAITGPPSETPTVTLTATPTPTDDQPGGQATPVPPTPTATRVLPSDPPTALDPVDEPDGPTMSNLYLPLVVR